MLSMEDILEDEDIFMENAVPFDYENLMEEVEIINKWQMRKQPEATIRFYVAECMEFPVMGEYHSNLTLEEAIKIYENIPAERMHGIKGIGFDLQDGDQDYSGEYELMSADKINRDLIDMIPHYKESPLVQKAISDMEKYLDKKKGKVQETEQQASEVYSEKKSVKPEKGEIKKSVLKSLKDFQLKSKAQKQNRTEEKVKLYEKKTVEL